MVPGWFPLRDKLEGLALGTSWRDLWKSKWSLGYVFSLEGQDRGTRSWDQLEGPYDKQVAPGGGFPLRDKLEGLALGTSWRDQELRFHRGN